MRSTLPALFRLRSEEKSSSSPKKQGPYYDLNLTISHNSYRTKIINPPSTSRNYELQASKTLHLKPLFGRYSDRHKRTISLSQSQNQESQGASIRNHSQHKLSQIDNVKFNLKRVGSQLAELKAKVDEVPEMNEKLGVEMKDLRDKLHFSIEEMEKDYLGEIGKLREKMSGLRRETNMEQKFLKKEIMDINEQLIDSISIIKGVEEQRATLKRLNF